MKSFLKVTRTDTLALLLPSDQKAKTILFIFYLELAPITLMAFEFPGRTSDDIRYKKHETVIRNHYIIWSESVPIAMSHVLLELYIVHSLGFATILSKCLDAWGRMNISQPVLYFI